MTDLEYVVRCCREHAEAIDSCVSVGKQYESMLNKQVDRLRARLSAVIALCEKRKPKHLKGQRDHELIKLFKEYPL